MTAADKPKPGDLDFSGAVWRSSSFDTSESNRIEIAFVDEYICMRDSDHPEGPVLVFTQSEWDAFVGGAKDGEFDLPDMPETG